MTHLSARPCFSNFVLESNSMTTQMCYEACKDTYAFFATQYSSQCFCDNKFGSQGTATDCTYACAGGSSETCGGHGANSVYMIGPFGTNPCTAEGEMTYDGRTIRCVYADGELHDMYQVTGGTSTCAMNEPNSCPSGTDIWVPRSYAHAKAAHDIYDFSGNVLVGIYRPADGCGSCTSYAMNSDAMATYEAAADGNIGWTSVAPVADPWFLRSSTYSEPSGDYTAYCWLSTNVRGVGWIDDVGWTFNDRDCDNC